MTGHEFLKQARLKKGLSLRELADHANVSHMHIKQMEDGKHKPGIDVLLRILSALSITTKDYLKVIGYEEPKRGKKVAAQGFEPRTLRI